MNAQGWVSLSVVFSKQDVRYKKYELHYTEIWKG